MSKHVAVLKGGVSNERSVSLSSGQQCAEALRRAGYQVTEVDVGFDIAERLRKLIEQTQFSSSQTSTNYGTVSVSMGVCMASEAENPEDLYVKADQALYRSKVSGRNRVTRHSSMSGQGSKNWMLYKKD